MVRDVSARASNARTRIWRLLGVLSILLTLSTPVFANGGVTFNDIALNGGAGITYQSMGSPARIAQRSAIEAMGVLPVADWRTIRALRFPMKANGAPGVALFDFDRDGDLDIYVTNGQGAANSLYSNQLRETGALRFVDVAATAGVTATSWESTGVCYGDIDNDGDDDLYVLSLGDQNRLFENQLAQTRQAVFTDITAAANAGGRNRHGTACSMGDINGDGRLDIVIANTFDDWSHQRPTFINETYVGFEHNSLLVNQGNNKFTEEASLRGLENIIGLPAATLTWAIAMVDYDLDGDVDIFFADSQGPPPMLRADERGYNRLYENDGTGHFFDVTFNKNLDKQGSWMGLSFGDYNCDGRIDFHATNLGDYMAGLGRATSRHFLGGRNGVFSDPGIGALVSSSFGWGTVTTDYDNDGDFDILYNGGMDVMTVISGDNPGNVLQNQGCTARFKYDFGARKREHRQRVVEGVAMGDLNADGFDDIVTVAAQRWVPNEHFLPFSGVLAPPFNSPLDPYTRFQGIYFFTAGVGQRFLNPQRQPGDLAIEMNSGGNGNGSVAVSLVGSTSWLPNAGASRSAFGAVLQFTPKNGKTAMKPLVGGASYASQDSSTITFGLAKAKSGTLDILGPGGARNRLYDVKKGERLRLPEIPCSYDARTNFGNYQFCVDTSLSALLQAGVISTELHGRLRSSALRAYIESH